MHIVLGGTGHTGSSVVQTLLSHGQAVTVITHDENKADAVRRTGAMVRVTDVRDVEGLQSVFRTGERLFLLNPPADPSTDTDKQERGNIQAILTALKGSGLKKIVAQSTYGAQPGEHMGDLSVLYELEQALARQPIRATIMRAAYLMSNWLVSLQTVKEDGVLHTFFPQDFYLPMVAPDDLGVIGAELLMQPLEEDGMHHVEGPQRYTPLDVAQAFGQILNKDVTVHTVAQEDWLRTYIALGFSSKAAESYIGMTEAILHGTFPDPEKTRHGIVPVATYLADGLAKSARVRS